MTDRALLQQALEALLTCTWSKQTDAAIAALRDRLAHCDRCGKTLGGPDHIHTCSPQQQVQEPKPSCGVDFADGLLTVSVGRICADGSMEMIHCEQIEIPVQEPRKWQGLTKDQREDFAFDCGSYETVVAIEQVLREKNGGGV